MTDRSHLVDLIADRELEPSRGASENRSSSLQTGQALMLGNRPDPLSLDYLVRMKGKDFQDDIRGVDWHQASVTWQVDLARGR